MMNDLAATRCKGWRGCYVGLKGDWKYQCQALELFSQNWKSKNCCEMCLAAPDGIFNYCNVGESAPWTYTTSVSSTNKLPSLGRVRGFSWYSNFADLLHVVWIGIGRDVVGGALMDLAESAAFSGSYPDRLDLIHAEFMAWCGAQTPRVHAGLEGLALGDMYKMSTVSTEYPVFRGKGFQCKVLVAFLADRLRRSELRLQYVCCASLAQFSAVLDSSQQWLSDDQRGSAVQHGQRYVTSFIRLAAAALREGRPRYKVRPKLHAFCCKIVNRMRGGSRFNPRYAWGT
jgi:hypothetical protein